MKLDLQVLRASLGRLLDHARDIHGRSVDIDADMYWSISRETVGKPESEPTDLSLGSLSDDWSEIEAIGNGTKEPFGYAIVWASAVLRAIGDRTI